MARAWIWCLVSIFSFSILPALAQAQTLGQLGATGQRRVQNPTGQQNPPVRRLDQTVSLLTCARDLGLQPTVTRLPGKRAEIFFKDNQGKPIFIRDRSGRRQEARFVYSEVSPNLVGVETFLILIMKKRFDAAFAQSRRNNTAPLSNFLKQTDHCVDGVGPFLSANVRKAKKLASQAILRNSLNQPHRPGVRPNGRFGFTETADGEETHD